VREYLDTHFQGWWIGWIISKGHRSPRCPDLSYYDIYLGEGKYIQD
jgi:hypothetical protein